jgi:hypothetical protein
MGRNAAPCFGFREGEHRVVGAARLERAALLEVLALEMKPRTGEIIERVAREYRRDVHLAGDALACLLDERPGEAGWRARHAREHGERAAGGQAARGQGCGARAATVLPP